MIKAIIREEEMRFGKSLIFFRQEGDRRYALNPVTGEEEAINVGKPVDQKYFIRLSDEMVDAMKDALNKVDGQLEREKFGELVATKAHLLDLQILLKIKPNTHKEK